MKDLLRIADLSAGDLTTLLGPNELQLGHGETIEDTARVISRYAKAFVIRTFADDDVTRCARTATIPVINALTDLHHPCQALAGVDISVATPWGYEPDCVSRRRFR